MSRFSLRSLIRSIKNVLARRPAHDTSRRFQPRFDRLEDRLTPANLVIINTLSPDPAQWTISGDNDNNDRALFGTPFNAYLATPIVNPQQIAEFRFADDVTIPGGVDAATQQPVTQVAAIGPRPISLVFGSNLTIGAGVLFRALAGGGVGGIAPPTQFSVGEGGAGGQGGAGGAGGAGSNAGSPGEDGASGSFGTSGAPGPDGSSGAVGAFNTAGPASGGTGGDRAYSNLVGSGGAGGAPSGNQGQDGDSAQTLSGGKSGLPGQGGQNNPLHPDVLSGGAGGGSGGTGGSGAGGSGGGGGGGGSGGHGSIAHVGLGPVPQVGGRGGDGGDGGDGSNGGLGGAGGQGGDGGGALQITVYGRLTTSGGTAVDFNVRGEDGAPGTAPRAGQPGTAAHSTGAPGQQVADGNAGGDGGDAGAGSAGSAGGGGGGGGGGAGGTIAINASVLHGQANFDIRGGQGGITPDDNTLLPEDWVPSHVSSLLPNGQFVDQTDVLNDSNPDTGAVLGPVAYIGNDIPSSGFIAMWNPADYNGEPFDQLDLHYWNGSVWSDLPATFFVGPFGPTIVNWTIPADWAVTTINGTTGYWVTVEGSALIRFVEVVVERPPMLVPDGGDGEDGRAILKGNSVSLSGQLRTSAGNSALSIPADSGPKASNPFAGNQLVPYLSDLEGGAEAYGVSKVLTKDHFTSIVSNAPSNSRVAIARFDAGIPGYDFNFPGYDLVALINLSDQPIVNPEFVAETLLASNSVALRVGGTLNDPNFTANATGDKVLGQLDAGKVYLTLVPEDVRQFTFRGIGAGTEHAVNDRQLADGAVAYVAPQAAPTAQDMTLTTPEDTPITFTVDATDPNGDALTLNSAFQIMGSLTGNLSLVQGQPLQVKFTPNSNLHGSFQFQYQVYDALNQYSGQATVTIHIAAAGDDPNLTVNDVTVERGAAIPLPITASLNDNDGSETLAVRILGIPSGSSPSVGTRQGASTWVIPADQLAGLQLLYNGDPTELNLRVQAITVEQSNFSQGFTEAFMKVTILAATASTPTVAGPASIVTTTEGTPVPLGISVSSPDADGSETRVLEIVATEVGAETFPGLAPGVVLSHGRLGDGGVWVIDEADLASTTIASANGTIGFRLFVQARTTELYDGTTQLSNGGTPQAFAYTINNVDPIVQLDTTAARLDEGDAFTRAGSFTDPGTEAWTATVDYGDGTGEQPLALNGRDFVLDHVYAQNGVYPVTVTIHDGEGSDVQSMQVLVDNVAPAVNVHDATTREGELFQRMGTILDPGADTWTATADYGDGSGQQALAVSGKNYLLQHTWSQPGTYTVTVRVTDSDGQTAEERFQVVVANTPPAVRARQAAPTVISVQAGERFRSRLRWRDAGAGPWRVRISYGSGRVVRQKRWGRSVWLNHVYEQAGTYVVKVKVYDGSGGSFTQIFTVQVLPRTGVATLGGVA